MKKAGTGSARVAALVAWFVCGILVTPPVRADGEARMIVDFGRDAPGGWVVSAVRLGEADAAPLEVSLLVRPDGTVTAALDRPDAPLRNELAAPRVAVVEQQAMAGGDLLVARAEEVEYSLDERIESGAAFVTSSVPVPDEVVSILRLDCGADPAFPPADGAGAGDDETLEEKADRLCPDGDCTDAVRGTVEVVIEILRRTGHDRAADLLQELLDKERFVVDTERRFSQPDQCAVFYYNPFIGPKIVSIAPECLCEERFASKIAMLAGLIALEAKNGYDTDLAVMVLMSGLMLELLDDKEREKMKQTFKGLQKLARTVEQGFLPVLSCFLRVIVETMCYDPKNPIRSVRELRRLVEEKKELDEKLKDLSEEDLERIKEALDSRLQRIIELIKAGAWGVLRLEFGLERACFDPEFIRFVQREPKPSVPEAPEDVEEGDLDGDGDPDIVTPSDDEDGIGVTPGFGDGDLGEPHLLVEPSGPEAIAIGDLDADGRDDLVVATRDGELALLRAPSPGTLDLSRTAFPLGGRASDLALADLDGDGALDVVVCDADARRLRLLVNRGGLVLEEAPGGGGILPPEGDPGPLAVARLDGDATPDTAVGVGSLVLVFPSLPGADGPFGPPRVLEPGAGPVVSLALGDLDGDGALDVLASTAGAGVARFLGDGEADFRPGLPLAVEGPGALRVGDLDRDGRLDVLVLSPGAGLLHVFYAPGGTGEGKPVYYEVGDQPSSLALPDLDGDGLLDVVVANEGSSDLVVFRNVTIAPRDLDQDGVEDGCAIRAGVAADCDADGVPDGAAVDAGLATDADLSGLPDACDRRFSLGWESQRVPFEPEEGEVEVALPIALLQRSEQGDLYDAAAFSFGITWDPERLTLIEALPAPPLAEAAATRGAHVAIESQDGGLTLAVALPDVPPGEAGDGGAAALGIFSGESVDLLTLRFATVGLAGASAPVATRVELAELPPPAVSPAPPPGWVRAGGGLFRIARAGEGGEATFLFEPPALAPRFRRGDSNASGTVDLSDAVYTLDWLFTGGPAPVCEDAADGNDDATVDLSDAVFVLGYLFLGTPAPPPPGPDACGEDGTPDDGLAPCAYPEDRCG